MTTRIKKLNVVTKLFPVLSFVAAALLLLGAVAPTQAAIVTQPAGLNGGDQYRLVFVTSTEIEGRNSAGGPATVAGYNTHATNAATAVAELNVLGTSWSAIVSVEVPPPGGGSFGTAKSNTQTDPGVDGVGVPIYNLDGEPVATGNADLWDGSIANAIDVTELGTAPPDQPGGHKLVWTGATLSGGSSGDWSLISPSGGWMYYGQATLTTDDWIEDLGGEPGWDGNGQTNSQMPIYAISGILTATAAVPEPSTFGLSALGVLSLGFVGWRRRRR